MPNFICQPGASVRYDESTNTWHVEVNLTPVMPHTVIYPTNGYGWYNADTAPKDGTVIIAATNDRIVGLVEFCFNRWHSWHDGAEVITAQGDWGTDHADAFFTQWTHLPKLPNHITWSQQSDPTNFSPIEPVK